MPVYDAAIEARLSIVHVRHEGAAVHMADAWGRLTDEPGVALVTGLLVVGVACAIAAWFVIREAGRLAAEPPPPVFDLEEAYEWVVEHVPDDVAATLTAEDVRRILEFQLEFFQRKGVSQNGSTSEARGPVVVGGAEQVAYILERCASTGEAYLPEQVHGVVETQLSYLRAIGAIGPPAGADSEVDGESPRD